MSLHSSVALPGFLTRLRARLGRRDAPPPPRHPFDFRYGTDTEGLLYADDLTTGHAHDCFNEGYYATAPSLFRGALECWRGTLSGWKIEDYTFIDLGCGKGRVLLLASQSPFRFVRGIELHPRLARVARRNIRKWLKAKHMFAESIYSCCSLFIPVLCSLIPVPCLSCRRITVESADVLRLKLPTEPVILFLFNSFGDEVLVPLMQQLAAEAGRRTAPIDLIYIHPDHDRLVAQTPGIELLRWTEIPFSEEDAAADVFGVSSDPVSVYRLVGMHRN